MSALPAPVLEPANLDLPLPAQLEAVRPALSENGAKLFLEQLLDAIAQAKETNDLRPVQEVIEAWYRSLLFVQAPGHEEAMNAAPDEGKGLTHDEVKARLGI